MSFTNGFGKEFQYDLNIQNDLNFNGNFNGVNWTISEGVLEDTLDFDRNMSTILSLGATQSTFNGDLIVNGNVIGTTSVITENLNVQDNLIELGTTNTTNLLNLGYYAHYDNGVPRFTGVIRDVNDGYTKIIDSSTEPTNTGALAVGDLGLFRAGSIIYSQSANQANFIAESTGNEEAQVILLNSSGSSTIRTLPTSANLDLLSDGDIQFKVQGNTGMNGEVQIGSTYTDIRNNLRVQTNAFFVDVSNTLTGIGTNVPTNKLTIDGTATDTVPILGLRSGNNNTVTNDGAQIAFGYNGTDDFQHFIQTRHNSGTTATNAIDFFLCDGTQNNTVTSGSNLVMSLDGGNVGIGTSSPTKRFEVNESNAEMVIRAQQESEDSHLYFATPFNNATSSVAKTAIIAEGQNSWSRSDLHFCLNNATNNSTEVSLSDSRMVIKSNGEIRSQNNSFYNSTGGAGNIIAGDVPHAYFTRNATQSIPNNTATTISLDTTLANRGTFSVSASGVTVPSTGLYQVSLTVFFEGGTLGGIARINYSGLTFSEMGNSTVNLLTINTTATINVNNAGINILPIVVHTTGSNRNVTARIQLTRIGNSI